MVVAFLVIFDNFLLYAFGRNIKCDMNMPVIAYRGGHHTQLNGIKRLPGIAVSHVCQKFNRIIIDYGIIASHALLVIINRLADKTLYIALFKRFQFKYD